MTALDRFWKIIESARARSGGKIRGLAGEIRWQLKRLNPDQIIAFEETLDGLLDAAYDWKLWGAAYVMKGGCSDDGFEYFRCWLVVQGRDVYERALADPDSLADLYRFDDSELEFEELLYMSRGIFEEKTGQEIPDRQRQTPPDPKGDSWEEDDLPALLPKLSKRYS